MHKFLLLLLCALMVLSDYEPALATITAKPAASEMVAPGATPSPNYKRYRGNSRRKRGPIAAVGRWGKRRKTRNKLRAAYHAKGYPSHSRKGVITVDKPVRNK